MKKTFCLLLFFTSFYGETIFAQEGGGESATNRLGQTLRIGQKTGIHLMYSLQQLRLFWNFQVKYGQ